MIVGTAGHIDHGKSTLVEALTGRPMDPLAEERRRGITLDLHFAELPLGGGLSAGVVDVPGHEDLVRTMVAGAGGIDLVLLVIAADDGIMPQTREHLAIVEQLRVPAGIAVITKADLVEGEWLEMVTGEVAGWLAASPIRFGPPLVTAARTGLGVEPLRAAIARHAAARPGPRPADDLFRLPIDRAFSLPGAGTVVTGTAWSGSLAVGDPVRVLPAGHEGRVRSLERHGAAVARSTPGERTAVAVAGLDRHALRRGDVLVQAGAPWEPTRALDARLELLPSAPRPLSAHTRLRVHLGTLEALARVQPAVPIPPGGSGLARLLFEAPVVARGGDRLVLRSYSPVLTIGGGEVLDPLPPLGRPAWPPGLDSAEPLPRLAALLARRRQGVAVAELPVLLGVTGPAALPLTRRAPFVLVSGTLVLAERVGALMARLAALVAAHHAAHPSAAGMPLETLRALGGALAEAAINRLVHAGELVLEQGTIRAAGFRPRAAGGEAALERVVEAIRARGLTPPTVAELETELGQAGLADACRLAAREGRLVAVERDRYFAPEAITGFRAVLERLAAAGPFAPSAVRDATGVSRKYLMPLLEWADRAGLTIRQGDARVAGPALSARPTPG